MNRIGRFLKGLLHALAGAIHHNRDATGGLNAHHVYRRLASVLSGARKRISEDLKLPRGLDGRAFHDPP